MNDIIAIKNGCKITFEKVYNTYFDKIYSFVFNQCKSETVSEEVVQQVFVKLWEKRDRLSIEYPLEVQLYRMTKSLFIDELRKEAHRRKYLESLENKYCLEYSNERLEQKDELESVFAIINKMPPKRKAIFMMSRVENLSYKEIAEILSVSPRTVENHISLAIKHLRQILAIFVIFIS